MARRASTRKGRKPNVDIKGQNIVYGNVSVKNGKFVQKVERKEGLAKLDKLFELLDQRVDQRLQGHQEEIKSTLRDIRAEAKKGKKADESKLEHWVGYLAGIAPDILDVMVASLAGPASAFTMVLKKVAVRAKAES